MGNPIAFTCPMRAKLVRVLPVVFPALLVTIASLFLAGCLQGSLHERNTSLSLYTHGKFGLEVIEDFLTSRTARLFSAEDLTITSSGTNPSVFTFQTSNSTIVLGCAAAVDSRGINVRASKEFSFRK